MFRIYEVYLVSAASGGKVLTLTLTASDGKVLTLISVYICFPNQPKEIMKINIINHFYTFLHRYYLEF